MKTLFLSGVKMKPSGLVDLVNSTDEEIVITKNGCPYIFGVRSQHMTISIAQGSAVTSC